MERDGRNSAIHNKHTAIAGQFGADVDPHDQSFNRDPDQYIPVSNVVRIMRRALPAQAKIADDAKEAIQECVSEFITFVTADALKKCHQECRKTITPDDVLEAMRSLGFSNYMETLSVFLGKHRWSQDPTRSHAALSHELPYLRRRASLPGVQASTAVQPPPQMAYPPLQQRRRRGMGEGSSATNAPDDEFIDPLN